MGCLFVSEVMRVENQFKKKKVKRTKSRKRRNLRIICDLMCYNNVLATLNKILCVVCSIWLALPTAALACHLILVVGRRTALKLRLAHIYTHTHPHPRPHPPTHTHTHTATAGHTEKLRIDVTAHTSTQPQRDSCRMLRGTSSSAAEETGRVTDLRNTFSSTCSRHAHKPHHMNNTSGNYKSAACR